LDLKIEVILLIFDLLELFVEYYIYIKFENIDS